MKVCELIEKLKELPQDAYIATYNDISWRDKDNPNQIQIKKYTYSNYPYDKPDFDYYNLE